MTGTSVVIPIRGLHGGKSRLASHLAPDQRAALVGGMAVQVIDAVAASGVAESILVVSRETDLLRILQADGGRPTLIHQPPQVIGLNAAIDLGRQAARRRDVDRLLVLSADLPLLTARAVADFVTSAGSAEVVLGTDRANLGTNALMLRGGDVIARFAFHFGPDSRRLHRREAGRIGARYVERDPWEVALDLDTPGDWSMLDAVMRERLLDPARTSRVPQVGAIGVEPMALVERA